MMVDSCAAQYPQLLPVMFPRRRPNIKAQLETRARLIRLAVQVAMCRGSVKSAAVARVAALHQALSSPSLVQARYVKQTMKSHISIFFIVFLMNT